MLFLHLSPQKMLYSSSTDFLLRMCILKCLLSIISILLICTVHANGKTFNVQDYGAVGDGKSNDTSAFVKAWNETCKADDATMIIPKGKTFLVYPVTFSGPCKSTAVQVQLSGIVKAPADPGVWKDRDAQKWLVFEGVKGLYLDGFGVLDGSGQRWWDQACRYHPGQGCTTTAPTALGFRSCNTVNMSNIFVQSSPQTHILVIGSKNVFFKALKITSPEISPNTDGIHISNSDNVWVQDSDIESGDDCVSIGDQCTNINVMYSKCGPGHGVSIGSLGRDGGEAHVENITVRHIQFKQTTNGCRIKTWQVGRGNIRNIEFSHLNFTNVKNPIIIDQYYCDVPNSCKATKTGVQISNVQYVGAYGTSATPVAINLNCSNVFPCRSITLQDIQLESAEKKTKVSSSCSNAFGEEKGTVQPKSCLIK